MKYNKIYLKHRFQSLYDKVPIVFILIIVPLVTSELLTTEFNPNPKNHRILRDANANSNVTTESSYSSSSSASSLLSKNHTNTATIRKNPKEIGGSEINKPISNESSSSLHYRNESFLSSTSSTVKPFKLILNNNLPLIPRNFTTTPLLEPDNINNSNETVFNPNYKSSLKKKGLVFTLSLRPKERIYNNNKPQLIFNANNATTAQQATSASAASAIPATTSFSSTISDLTQATFGKSTTNYYNNNNNNGAIKTKTDKVLDKLKDKISTTMATKSYSASLTRGTNYGMKNDVLLGLNSTAMKEKLGKVFPSTTTTASTTTIRSTTPVYIKSITKPAITVEAESTTIIETSTPFLLAQKIKNTFVSNVGGYLSNQEFLNHHRNNKTVKNPSHNTANSNSNANILERPFSALNFSQISTNNNTKSGTTNSTDFDLEETRYVITADQIGGNRPTERPFHFTTTIPTTTTTRKFRNQLNHYTKVHSPHNHIYAPTQNPIYIAHNDEELSPEDVQNFKEAHSSFGSKVNGEDNNDNNNNYGKGTKNNNNNNLPKPSAPTSIKLEDSATKPTLTFARGSIRGRIRPSIITTLDSTTNVEDSPPITIPKKQPESASSGRKNSHIKLNTNNNANSDANLPFYKEPGGVFEHSKYNENEPEPNEIKPRFNEGTRPGIKYAPKVPATQAQQQQLTYDNQQRRPNNYPNQHQHVPQHHLTKIPVQPQPQYVTVTQQPLYITPVPIQQMVHHHPQNYPVHQPPLQPHYYEAVAVPPRPQQPVFYNAPPQHHSQHQQQQVPIQNHHHHLPHQPLYNRGHAPPQQVQHHYNNQRPLPLPPPPARANAVPVHNNYNNRNPPTTPTKNPQYYYVDDDDQKDFNNPPPPYDPASDYFYGDPRPPKPSHSNKSKKKKPANNNVVEEVDYEEEEDPEPVANDYDERQRRKSNNNNRGKNNNNDKYDDGEDYRNHRPKPKRPTRPTNNRNNEDYDTYPNENVGEYIRPLSAPERSRPNDNVGEFIRPQGSPRKPVDNYDVDPDFVGLANNFEGRERNRPFRPSQEDRPLRPSQRDQGPYFNHPNIEYPARRGPAPAPYSTINSNRDLTSLPPLDPIYTRTLLQYDQENQAPSLNDNFERVNEREQYPDRYNDNDNDNNDQDDFERPSKQRPNKNRNNNRPKQQQRQQQHQDEDEDAQEEEEEDEPQRRPNRPAPQRKRPSRVQEEEDEEEEEEQEEEERPRNNRREKAEEEEEEEEERPRKNRKQQDEEPEEEEEEEERPQKKRKQDDEEEEEEEEEAPAEEAEEEEEEEEQPKRKQNRRQDEKKPPPKKPQPEKPAGNLDDDISEIEREYGGSGYDPFAVQQQQLAPNAQVHPAFKLNVPVII